MALKAARNKGTFWQKSASRSSIQVHKDSGANASQNGPIQIHKKELDRHGAWADLVERYSASALSVVDDRIIALSGVYKKYAILMDDEYVAGMWKKRLLYDLSWRADGEDGPEMFFTVRCISSPKLLLAVS